MYTREGHMCNKDKIYENTDNWKMSQTISLRWVQANGDDLTYLQKLFDKEQRKQVTKWTNILYVVEYLASHFISILLLR